MALARTGLRVHTFRRLDVDDGFLIFSVLTLTAATVLVHFNIPLLFLQNYASLGQIIPGPDFPAEMLMAKKLETASTVMIWVSIYGVKYCYMFFFKKLVSRVRKVQLWWWLVMGLLVPMSLIASAFDFTICPNETLDFFSTYHPNPNSRETMQAPTGQRLVKRRTLQETPEATFSPHKKS